MKKILVQTFYYPPMGGAGVQRIVKFVKYLPDFGYAPVVVARAGAENIPEDPALSADVASCTTYRVELMRNEALLRRLCVNKLLRHIPGFPLKWWVVAAKRMCDKVEKLEKPDLIFVTAPPYFGIETVAALAKKNNIPWVLDLRDPWALDPLTFYSTWLHYRLNLKTMSRSCHGASAVIMNTPRALLALKSKFPKLPSNKLFCITNGWDKHDFHNSIMPTVGRTFSKTMTLTHSGGFLTLPAIKMDPTSRKVLGLRGRGRLGILKYSLGKSHMLARSPYYLFKALRSLLDADKISEDDIRIVFVGNLTQEERNLAAKFDLGDMVEFKGYVSHRQAIEALASTDALFLAIHEPGNNGFPLTMPGKTYEYLASGKPILALVPPGDARDFVIASGLGIACDPTDVEQIAQTLLDLLTKHRNGSLNVNRNDQFIGSFERKKLAKRLAEVFDFAIGQYRLKAPERL